MGYKVTTADIQKMRKATGAGMMDCKTALTEAEGDFDKAVEIIRKKGQAIANKRADREANEGAVFTKIENGHGAMLALNCETDFVARNENFIALAQKFLDAAFEAGAKTIDDVKKVTIDGTTIEDLIHEQIGVIGEKIDIPFYAYEEAPYIHSYIHFGNKLAAMVLFNKETGAEVANNVAMQVAAMAPIAVDKDDVPADIVEKEIEIAKEQARNENKPENLLEKIAMGRLNKFYQETTLMNQAFISDNKKKIKDYIKENDADLKVLKFVRFSLS